MLDLNLYRLKYTALSLICVSEENINIKLLTHKMIYYFTGCFTASIRSFMCR